MGAVTRVYAVAMTKRYSIIRLSIYYAYEEGDKFDIFEGVALAGRLAG
jgi:hypothetical protein